LSSTWLLDAFIWEMSITLGPSVNLVVGELEGGDTVGGGFVGVSVCVLVGMMIGCVFKDGEIRFFVVGVLWNM
jgi:hypothetical protein